MAEVLSWVLDRLHHIGLSPDTESLAAGLLCGQKSLFAADVLHDFRDAGMSHLLAVSGLHVGLLWGLIFLVLRRLIIIPYYFGWYLVPWYHALRLVTVCLLWLYVWVIGLPPSAVRAALFISLTQISPLFQVKSWSWENLMLAALLMLCVDPSLYGNVSFQLSFAATAGILAFRPLIVVNKKKEKDAQQLFPLWHRSRLLFLVFKAWPYLRSLFWLSFSAQLFTAPICAYYFHHLPLLGWVQGFLVIPVISALLYGLVLLMLFPATWGMVTIGGETLYHWLSLPVELLSWWVIQVAHVVSRLELFLVGGRVEFYPSMAETIILELCVICLSFSLLGIMKERDWLPYGKEILH